MNKQKFVGFVLYQRDIVGDFAHQQYTAMVLPAELFGPNSHFSRIILSCKLSVFL